MKVAIAIALTLTGAAHAQSNLEVNSSVQFNFASPGARSLGIGGAFTGLADDATTAYTNPAGLVNVVSPEVSAELRAQRQTNTFPTRGHALGPSTGRDADKVDGIEDGESHDSAVALSFASFVYPVRKWSFAFYRHNLADMNVSSRTEGIFYSVRDAEDNASVIRAAPSRNELRLEIAGYGVAAGYQLHKRLSLGLSAARYTMDMRAETLRFAFTPFGPASYEQVINTQTQSGRDSTVTASAGLLWRATDILTVGATYRQKSAFSLDVSSDKSPAPCRGDFNVPDVASAGASLLLPRKFTVTADYKLVRYSRLTRNFVAFDAKNRCEQQSEAIDYAVRDAGEAHLGVAKLVYIGRRSLILSAGWWNDPAHSLRFAGSDDVQGVLFNGGRSDNHFSAGLGLNIDEFRQVYAAYDISRRQQTLSISTILRF